MKFIDICAGIGGFRYGLEQAGHECVGFIEIDKFARKSYMAMYEAEKEWNAEDVTKIRADEIPKADIWCFGFPCTDISICGRRFGIDGARSGIFFAIMELVKEKPEKDRPKFLLVENVENLIRINDGWDFAKLLFEMESAGYNIEWCMYNSKNYNVPQSRKRFFIIGHNGENCGRKILPFPRESATAIKQIIGGRQGERVYDPQGVAVTLTAAGGGFAGSTGLYFMGDDLKNDVDRIRKLTPKECFKLQGFSDYLFDKAKATGISDSQLYKQAGNAVTSTITYEIGKSIKEIYG